jgi:hypothetical protein
MLNGQGGACAICKTPAADLDRRICVDHDHVTGGVRGLLCSNCNSAIGKLQDDPDVVAAALAYLTAHKSKAVA